MMRVKAVLFDLFDTLLMLESGDNDDREAYYVPSLKRLHGFLARNGIRVSFHDFSRIYFEIRDRLYEESRETLDEPHFNVRVSQTLQRLGYDLGVSDPVVIGATMAFADEFVHYVSLDKEAIAVLERLHRKYKLGLVSNFALPECGWQLLEESGLAGFFGVVLISGEVNRRKPSREIFEMALEALDVAASEAVFVGDMPDLDVKGPKSVGMKTVLIKRRFVEGIEEAKPDKVIMRLGDLPAILEDF